MSPIRLLKRLVLIVNGSKRYTKKTVLGAGELENRPPREKKNCQFSGLCSGGGEGGGMVIRHYCSRKLAPGGPERPLSVRDLPFLYSFKGHYSKKSSSKKS